MTEMGVGEAVYHICSSGHFVWILKVVPPPTIKTLGGSSSRLQAVSTAGNMHL